MKNRIETTEDILDAITRYERSLPFFKMRVDGHEIRIATPNSKCLYFATSYETRESETNDWIKTFPDDAVFFDIGANVGIFSLLASVWTNARIVAFEPHFASYYAFVRTLLENGLEKRIRAFPIALTDRSEFGSFFASDSSAGKSLNQFGTPNSQYKPTGDRFLELAAVSTTLDHFVTESGVSPSHIKIDVDGLELAVLQGGNRILTSSDVKSILVELEGTEEAEIGAYMVSLGYERQQTGTANAIFRRP